MTNPVDPVGTGAVDVMPKGQLQYDQLTEGTEGVQSKQSGFGRLVETALQETLIPKGSPRSSSGSVREITSGDVGTVGASKSEIVSKIDMPGAPISTGKATDQLDTTAVKFNDLYRRMTVHHAAWSIAMRMQRDISQILRST